jgi:hypothetical protein
MLAGPSDLASVTQTAFRVVSIALVTGRVRNLPTFAARQDLGPCFSVFRLKFMSLAGRKGGQSPECVEHARPPEAKLQPRGAAKRPHRRFDGSMDNRRCIGKTGLDATHELEASSGRGGTKNVERHDEHRKN